MIDVAAGNILAAFFLPGTNASFAGKVQSQTENSISRRRFLTFRLIT